MTWEEFERINKRKSAAVTAGICALLVLILFLFGFTPPYPPEEPQGMTIDFGDSATGSGAFEPNTSSAPPSSYQPAEQEMLTQDVEETITLPDKKETKPKNTTNKTNTNNTTQTEKIDDDLLLNPNKPLNTGTNSTSEGNTTKGGNQGDPDGDPEGGVGPGSGTTNGNGWALAGRDNLALPKPPAAENEEGDIRVKISVDKNGNVVKAEYAQDGSTISDPVLISQAIAAAKKAKFTAKADAQSVQIGYITYRYRYN